ncbi:hypothetical protein Gohar_001338 [Gossypium harknessii]|uniref:Carbohydrate kinase PfkB domain-containing protein n=1 Tax=Gossypium harknessii TaxID=34285 RepID=A0A7J9I3L5_9ROSI|nr:hypothetical protein [Gossypium harknessii]
MLDTFRAKLHRANVNFLSEPIEDGTTGAVIVLTIPDAQRTMLAYQVSVTDGHRGSYLGVKAEAVYIPPPCEPVDTGAGDAFASAARIAATDVGQQGTRLSVQDAVDIAESTSEVLV